MMKAVCSRRNISLSCSSRPRRTQRCAATEPFGLGPTSILLPRPIEGSSTSISRRHISRSQPHDQQRRFYNYHPGGNRERSPPPYDPEHREARLREAKPLIHWRGFRTLNTPSTYTVVVVAITGALIFYFSNLETVPVSGRTRFNVYSPESVKKAGEMEYKRLLWELEQKGVRLLPDWDPRTVRVKRVMARLIPFSGMQGENWEVYVVDDPHTANAFVLPGGKVFVFSGILGLARNDSGLATVLGHEIAHNLADHHGERLSQDIGASIVLWSLVILGGAFGLGPFIMHFFGSRFLDVAFGFPMSRLQESEADYIGLMMMAEACYDPREAATFWSRMEKAAGQEVPEWMSTHPTNMSRIKKIQEWLPQAMEKRAQSDCSTTSSFADRFRDALRTGQAIILI
ncbi:peptidase family M48-domain-containing protein [Corynascus novoguineensis]|uniref:Peptidase family M48-domain-containing protein n=1 Tax=Corynascus novoguineensis TaxID=1126955 RepID=A0AAN7HM81_9PEZI|nr:peptidase family M48-domain-containing protein [Corynascus novoguineensis]